MSIPEFKVARSIQHPNIVKLKEIIRLKKDELALVYENVEDSLFNYFQYRRDRGQSISEA